MTDETRGPRPDWAQLAQDCRAFVDAYADVVDPASGTILGSFLGRILRTAGASIPAVPDTGQAREPEHVVTQHWDVYGGDVLSRTCSCGEEWTRDEERCPQDEGPALLDRHGIVELLSDALADHPGTISVHGPKAGLIEVQTDIGTFDVLVQEHTSGLSGDTVQAPDVPDIDVREELVDVLDTHMRLDDRADAERVADVLIARPDLLRALLGADTTTEETSAETPTYRRTRPRRTGQVADLGRDLGTVEALIAEAPADYPGLGQLYRRREELIDQIRTGADRSTSCFIAGCDNTEIDERGPVWLRDGTQHQACTDHWAGIFRVLGEQVSWERDAMRTTSTTDTTEQGETRG